jgi:tetratricopeptide (TPR) repeat protein
MKLAGIGFLSVIATLSGCKAPQAQTERLSTIEPVRFQPENYLGRDVQVKNENDPEQLINFALSLSARGRHDQAAEFFQEAAGKFQSEGNELAVSCRAAAANEFLQAGDIKSFREAVQELKREMNRFQTASVDKQTATVLALGEIALGADKPSPTTPAPLWDLYPTAKLGVEKVQK